MIPVIRHSFRSFKRPSDIPFPLLLHRQQPISSQNTHADTFATRERTLVSLFESCSTMRDAAQIHALTVRAGFEQHVFVAGRIVTFCAASPNGSVDHAAALFALLRYPDRFLYNTMIRGLGRALRPHDAFLLFETMRGRGKPPDNFTLSFLLKICTAHGSLELGRQLHGCATRHGLASHIFVTNALLHMYSVFKEMGTARDLFEEMLERDLVSWNTIIDGYVNCGLYKEALRTFLSMQRSGFGADEATVVVVLSACSELGALDFGRWVHSNVAAFSLDGSVSVSNSLVDMYAKCGAIDKSIRVFEEMKERNVVSWNSIILGFAMHGHTQEVIGLFDRMRKEEFEEPNDITFLGLLCACSHGGLVEQGRQYFDSMRRDYCITPSVKHYGCMVDLLGRAGLVRDAYELIRSMPMECNAVVWRTLLGACRVHGDLELGKRVLGHLGDLEPDYSSDYVLLSHMYASAGRWNDVLEVRESMKVRAVQKPKPGKSLVGGLPSVAC